MRRVNSDELVQQACHATGLDDFGESFWREGLDQLVDALDAEARLNDIGRVMVPGELTTYLQDRLRIVAHRREHPEVAGGDVVPPIVIVGQGRTGTTILYDLLAQDLATRVPRTWEVDRPVPPPTTATYETDPRIDEVEAQLAMVDLVIPEFRAMHPMGARLAQECVRITASDFRSMIFPTQYRVPSYGRWLLHEADMSSAYRWHRVFLQHLQSQHPTSQWVLKSPGHIWCLDALLAEYPDALLVQTHRDPLRIIASLGSLVAVLRSIGCDDPSIPEAAAEFAEYIVDGLDRSVDARQSGVVASDRVVDTQFADFMRDPFVVIRTIYDRLDLELTPETEQRMRDFLAANPHEGAHRYTWADTDLDEAEWRDRAHRYQEYFAVPSEALG
ncbi:MAG: sulfotransferase family protein [Acidimicrobiia bacterium]